MSDVPSVAPLSPVEKARLALRVCRTFASVRIGMRREPLPTFVERLGHTRPAAVPTYPVARLSRAVDRTLRLGSRRPTCLVSSLVLFRLLREQGEPAELVIGLPAAARTKDAHAWVELGGRDVGPPPGRGDHREFARLG